MSQELPFKTMNITLSEEAYRQLTELKAGGAFQSDSAGVEECVRAVYTILEDVGRTASNSKDWRGNPKGLSNEDQVRLLIRVVNMLTDKFGRAYKP